jgi:hypothetical protein
MSVAPSETAALLVIAARFAPAPPDGGAKYLESRVAVNAFRPL